jgi:hypothetical protein
MELTMVCLKWFTSWLSYYVHFFSCKQFDGQKEVEQCEATNDDCMLPKRKYLKYKISKTLMHGFFKNYMNAYHTKKTFFARERA